MKANLLTSLGEIEETQKWLAKSSRRHRDNLDVRLAEARFLIRHSEPQLALKSSKTLSKCGLTMKMPSLLLALPVSI